MIGVVLTVFLVPIVLAAGVIVHKSQPAIPDPPSEEELYAEQIRPAMEALYREAFEHGYVYALRGEVRRPTAAEREQWAYSLPAPDASTFGALQAVA
ncbi:hypothetical protein BN000_01481 [Mycobacterium europaeum]|uniref:Uncharacterized protein n=1 Tax=Mycobacterium europaeum TaxID=761804 RepID=A0A0U1D5V6_9MYCO|nr:hypothetical protein [Mycobacterium europaeum]CQD07415.1 hypothetical protein BN000_01481 [Mycobacterium europaeum]